jgi:hypothetical protein
MGGKETYYGRKRDLVFGASEAVLGEYLLPAREKKKEKRDLVFGASEAVLGEYRSHYLQRVSLA